MRSLRSLSIAAITLIASGSGSLLYASPIQLLSQTYSVSGYTYSYTSDAPLDLNVTIARDPASPGNLEVSADGSVDSSGGFISSSVGSQCPACGEQAFATLDFLTTSATSIDLTTSGTWIPTAGSRVEFIDATDNLVLLNYDGTSNGFYWNLAGSFLFALDSSKQYRLQTSAFSGGADPGWAQVKFSSPDGVLVPEPSSFSLLFVSLIMLRLMNEWSVHWPERRRRVAAARRARTDETCHQVGPA
jgi:hypothetical protein